MNILESIGLIKLENISEAPRSFIPVLWNGVVLGYVAVKFAKRFISTLRRWKVNGKKIIPDVCLIHVGIICILRILST